MPIPLESAGPSKASPNKLLSLAILTSSNPIRFLLSVDKGCGKRSFNPLAISNKGLSVFLNISNSPFAISSIVPGGVCASKNALKT